MRTLIILFIISVFCFESCQETKGKAMHGHEKESLSFTLFSEGYELFVEFDELHFGEPSALLMHFTRLSDYKPVLNTKIEAQLDLKSTTSELRFVQPGVFKAELTPKEEGVAAMSFKLHVDGKTVEFTIPHLHVEELGHHHEHHEHGEADHAHDDDHGHDHADEVAEHAHEEGISFLKEQAWNGDFAVEEVLEAPFASVIRCSGELLPAQKDEQNVTANVAGKVILLQPNLIVGKKVRKGEAILTIVSEQIDNNLQQRFETAKARYESALAHYERDQKLLDEKIVAKTRFENTKANYLAAKSEFENVSKNYQQGKTVVKAPMNGVISQMQIGEGQYVASGDPLLVVNRNEKVIVKALLPKKYASEYSSIQNAYVKTEYSDTQINLSGVGGRRIPTSVNIGGNSPFIPVFFEAPLSEKLIPNSFAEIFLETKAEKTAIAIPRSSLVESHSAYFVYVQLSGEAFEEREVKLGNSTAERVEIVEGLKAGERVVTKGAYRIKRASVSGAVPHGHSH